MRTPLPAPKTFVSTLAAAWCVVFSSVAITGWTEADFRAAYEYYFPKEPDAAKAGYRYFFDTHLVDDAPHIYDPPRIATLYRAFHGDASAFKHFVHDANRDAMGAPGEDWSAECLLLLLRLGDEKFAALLKREPSDIRERVAQSIEPPIALQANLFPKTRALYSYRYTPMSKQELAERSRSKNVADQVVLSAGEFQQLERALKSQPRFSGVRLFRPDDPRHIALVVAPNTLSKKDISDLETLINRIAPSQHPHLE